MASYKIFFKKSAEKELRAVSNPDLSRLIGKIHALSLQPRPAGVQMLKGHGRFFRLRQGHYRIIYEVNDEAKEIAIIKVGHRREVYD